MSGSTAHAHSTQPWPRMTQDMLMPYGQAVAALPKSTPALTQSHDQFAFPQTHYSSSAAMSQQTQQDMDNNNTRPPMEEPKFLASSAKKNNSSKRNGQQPAAVRRPIEPVRTMSRSIANSILLAPIIKNKRHETVNCDLQGVVIDPWADRSNNATNGSPKTRIAIATDSVLSPAKKHIAKVFLRHGVTGSFSPNLDKLVEIVGDMSLLFQSYKTYCTKKHLKTVNKETYARLFRNEFKRKVGAR